MATYSLPYLGSQSEEVTNAFITPPYWGSPKLGMAKTHILYWGA